MGLDTTQFGEGADKAGAWLLESLGVVLGVGALWVIATNPDPFALTVAKLLAAVGLPVSLIYVGHRLGRDEIPSSDRWNVAKFSLFGLGVGSVVGVWILLRQTIEGVELAEPAFLLFVTAAVGAVGGGASGLAYLRHFPEDDAGESIAVGDGSVATGLASVTDLSADATATAITELADVLRDRKRVYLVYYLRDTEDQTATVDELIDHLQVVEQTSIERAGRREELRIDLYHNHLPRMADAGLVSFDRDRGVVRYDPRLSIETR